MSKRRGHDGRTRLDPEDVLAGRIKPDAAELLELIHRVNPTGRGLDAREEGLRYAQKARLQSLLVRRYGPELSVIADPENEGTVSIHHRGHGRDGCHAVLDTLDEDARAWVRRELDLGPPSSEAPPAPAARPSRRGAPPPTDDDEGAASTDASPESLVRRAEDAEACYDFERARTHLERAVAASGFALGPAAALLALLVETLGDDAAALALQPSLSRSTLADAEVRALLALAAARSGDPGEAVALLRGASEHRTAEVSAALASRALEAGDAAQAAAHVAELRKRDPAHRAIAGLAEEIARVRAAARGPVEAELSALVIAGRQDEAEKKAAEVLARWPESEAARRVVRAAEERRRLLQEAEGRRARELEAAHQEEREALQVKRVRAALDAPDPREGLLAWLDLDPALQRRVEAPAAAELLRWLDQTARASNPAARVEAVLAVAAARERFTRDPQGALDALDAHEATLERVPEARRIAREARAAIAAQRAARAREEVAEARRDLARGDAAAALTRLTAPALRDLGDEGRAEAEALRAEAAQIVFREKRVAEVGRLRRSGQLFEARALAGELLAEARVRDGGAPERLRWEQERRSIQEEIQRAFHVEIDHGPSPFGEEALPDATLPMMEAPFWVTEDGGTLVLTEGHGRWVWLQLVDVASRTVRADMLLCAPEPMEYPIVHVVGSTAWLICERGSLLAIDVDRLTVELFRPAREIVSTGRHVGGAAVAADRGALWPRYFWVTPADEDGYACPVQVIDLEARRVVREVTEVIRLATIAGTREARIGCFKSAGLVLHEDRGVPVPGGRFPRQDVAVVFAAAHPAGEGLVATGSIASSPWHVERISTSGSRRRQLPAPAGRGARSAAVLVDMSAGSSRSPWIIDDDDHGTVTGLASSRDTGLCALTYIRDDLVWEILVLRPTGGTFELLHRSEAPQFTSIVRDAGGRHLFLYTRSPLILTPLGPTAPDLPEGKAAPSPWISDLSGAPACLGSAGARAEAYQAVAESVKTQTRDVIAAASRALQKEDDPARVVERARALATADNEDARANAGRLREWLWARHPEDAHVRLLRADDRSLFGRWEEVREILAPCTSASFPDDDHAAHFSHLLALSALHLGDVEEARRRAAEAARHGGSCKLEALAAVLQPRPATQAPVREATEATEDPPLLTQLVWAVHAADACLDAGDPEGALAALDRRRFEVQDEVQVLARRAEAWLGLPAPGRRRIAKIMGLARFVDAHGGADGEREELPMPGAWDRARLDEVAGRAAAWLDERLAGGAGLQQLGHSRLTTGCVEELSTQVEKGAAQK